MRTLDPKAKKRKLADPASNKFPLKKAAVGTASSTKPTAVVKKEPGSISITTKAPSQAVKDAKADSSFFSAPKPKAKLPSFKKAPVPVQVKKEESNNIAVPSSYDPFQEVLKSMKARKESPAVSTPPAASTPNSMLDSQQGLARNLRKKKSVTWAPDHQLESIKLIEKAIYDDDPVDVSIFSSFRVLYYTLIVVSLPLFVFYLRFFFTQGTHMGHSLRDLDRGEGAALHAILFEEVMDWAEPLRKQTKSYFPRYFHNETRPYFLISL
jgi:protein phosphatase 1 regulatory subunit 10